MTMGRLKIRAAFNSTFGDSDYWNFYILPTVEISKSVGYMEDDIEFPIWIDFEWLCFWLAVKIGRKEE